MLRVSSKIKMKLSQTLFTFSLLKLVLAAPAAKQPEDHRQAKNLAYLDYLQAADSDYQSYDLDNDFYSLAEDNELSRTIPSRKRLRPQSYNSPIYYIRLPPQPYMFVPGLGYVSQPPSSPVSQFVNLPVSFVANGKPTQIYQWSNGIPGFPTNPPPTQRPTKPTPKPIVDSTIHRLPGQYNFNGKPDDIFVLRDSYNSLYGDALQNFYP